MSFADFAHLTVAPRNEGGLLPEGTYRVKIISSGRLVTAKGEFVSQRCEVVSGPFKGRPTQKNLKQHDEALTLALQGKPELPAFAAALVRLQMFADISAEWVCAVQGRKDPPTLGELDAALASCVGCEVTIRVKREVKDGQVTTKVTPIA